MKQSIKQNIKQNIKRNMKQIKNKNPKKVQIKQTIYNLYRTFNHSVLISNLAFLFYNYLQILNNPHCRPSCFFTKFAEKQFRQQLKDIKVINPKTTLKVAFICDEMTYKTFRHECQSIFLTPNNWKVVLENWKPDFLFCESAWLGLQEYNGCWRGKIYKNQNVTFNSRKTLMQILHYCKQNHIKTAFWNKEDPTYFNDKKYDFVSTALLFDYIFTTSVECISKYQELGHSHVSLLQFAANPSIYNPLNSSPQTNTAIFAGSWYGDNAERCHTMETIFDMVLNLGIELVIYDRNYNTTSYNKQFPQKYQPYIHPAIPFEELGNVIKQSQYAININTVIDSSTMFARRVFELILCNTVIISNPSDGMKEIFPQGILFSNQNININDLNHAQQFKSQNIDVVLKYHTTQQRFKQICLDMNIDTITFSKPSIAILYPEDLDNFSPTFCEYFYICSSHETNIPDLESLSLHFLYLSSSIGIKKSTATYKIKKETSYLNTLWCSSMWEKIHKETELLIYHV